MSSSRRAIFALIAVATTGVSSRAWGWPASSADRPSAFAVDASADVVVAGSFSFWAEKFAAADGRLLWRSDLTFPFLGATSAVAADAAGDVVVAGGIGDAFTVVKLASGTGATLWTTMLAGTLPSGSNRALALALDAAGDAVVAGRMEQTGSGNDFAVVKLAGADGSELWRYTVTGTLSGAFDDEAVTVAVDAAGDVAAGGRLLNAGPQRNFTVVKLAGADGSELWRRSLAAPDGAFDEAHAVAFDGTGAVLATGELTARPHLNVIKLAATNGAEQWSYESPAGGSGTALAVDAANDVVTVGGDGGEATAAKVAGGTGAELWRSAALAPSAGPGILRSVALTSTGDAVVTGDQPEFGTGPSALTVVRLSGASGATTWRFDLDRVGGRGQVGNVAVAVTPSDNVMELGAVDYNQTIVAHLAGATGAMLGCGGSTFDPGELCDDGNAAAGDGCDASCRLEPSAESCRHALASSGFDYFRRRLTALHKCRHRINAGKPPLSPALCLFDLPTVKPILAAARKARTKITTFCTDAIVASLGVCATTVDGLIDPSATSGCFVANHAAAADAAVDATFPRILAPTEIDERKCQRASAKAALGYTSYSGSLLQRCLDLQLKLPVTATILYHGTCRLDDRFGVPIGNAAANTASKIDAKCPLPVQASIGGCVGCAVETSNIAVDAALAEEYGR